LTWKNWQSRALNSTGILSSWRAYLWMYLVGLHLLQMPLLYSEKINATIGCYIQIHGLLVITPWIPTL
jgi:hypothetical protein